MEDWFVQPEGQQKTGLDPSVAWVPTTPAVSRVRQTSLPSTTMSDSVSCLYHPKCLQYRKNVNMITGNVLMMFDGSVDEDVKYQC